MRAHWIKYCKVICKMNAVRKWLRKLTFMVSLSFSLSWKEEQIKGEQGICLKPSFSLFKVRFLFQLCIFLQIKQHFVPYMQKMPSTPTQTIWYMLFSPIVFSIYALCTCPSKALLPSHISNQESWILHDSLITAKMSSWCLKTPGFILQTLNMKI